MSRVEARLRLLTVANTVLLLLTIAFWAGSCGTVAAPQTPQVLTVSELNVVDPQGVVRVRIGGDLPDAIIKGRRVPRGQKAAGVLIYDDTGQERGGYVTFHPWRQAALTLDSHDAMTMMLIAGAEGGAALQLMEKGDLVELRVGDETGPSLHAVRNKQVVFHQPPVIGFEKSEICTELRGGLAKNSREQVLEWCRRRMSEEACQSCLPAQ